MLVKDEGEEWVQKDKVVWDRSVFMLHKVDDDYA